MAVLYRRKVSSTEAGEGRVMITKDRVSRFPAPGERCGFGYPKRRSHARNVFGLTLSSAAASLVFKVRTNETPQQFRERDA